MSEASNYVSRGGLKLERALDEFDLDPSGFHAADLGCSTGGFTDVLIQRGAERVYSVDTAYGELAWKLRQHERVVVMERSNALHVDVPSEVNERGGVDLVVIDLGWTPQRLAIPAALKWLSESGRVVTLIKPHYERTEDEKKAGGVVDDDAAEAIARRVADALPEIGVVVQGLCVSPVRGGAKGKGKKGTGNLEWLALLERAG
ncbi:MAG: SAM-dependent methyltransferase [Planctomycetota bacterium]